jgi:hypothetical protein
MCVLVLRTNRHRQSEVPQRIQLGAGAGAEACALRDRAYVGFAIVSPRQSFMTHVTYKIVRHEDGWAYTVDGAFSESFPTHAEALDAARQAAAEQRSPGRTESIEYEDEKGKWHSEVARGDDRPDTTVEDSE